jgi:hypothetical protein
MGNSARLLAIGIFLVCSAIVGCNRGERGPNASPSPETNVSPIAEPIPETTPVPTQKYPNLQEKILEGVRGSTESPIGGFDFRNFKYPLPRGWQDSDGKEAELVNGRRSVTMTDEVERIGLSMAGTGFFDATGDGTDEAVIVLKIETGGSAVPQLVYIFEWKNGQPQLIWNFRTGDRSDGGLKNIRVENGEVVVELFGQDRYIVGELDTAKITGDEEQICCPTHWTRSRYKWNGSVFRLLGKRLTFQTADEQAPPIENMVEMGEKLKSGKK